MAGLPTGGSQVFSERARKSFMYHALSKPVGDDSQTMSSRGRGIDRYAEQSSSGATCWRGGGPSQPQYHFIATRQAGGCNTNLASGRSGGDGHNDKAPK